MSINIKRKLKGQSRMDNPEKTAKKRGVNLGVCEG